MVRNVAEVIPHMISLFPNRAFFLKERPFFLPRFFRIFAFPGQVKCVSRSWTVHDSFRSSRDSQADRRTFLRIMYLFFGGSQVVFSCPPCFCGFTSSFVVMRVAADVHTAGVGRLSWGLFPLENCAPSLEAPGLGGIPFLSGRRPFGIRKCPKLKASRDISVIFP